MGVVNYQMTHKYCSNRLMSRLSVKGQINSIMVSVCVCQAGRLGSNPARSICFRKVNVLNLPTGAADWLTKGRTMCYRVYMIMHVKIPQLSVVWVGHCVPLAGFCLSLYGLYVPKILNRYVNMIQTNTQIHPSKNAVFPLSSKGRFV